ncbi:calpain-3-like [Saccostrea echinata]|uniref:calpain-3-like n=1 Tax=Saccostrea echinata TaxID=191078 RepID=UPI002A80676A|nr:calpain-3-like [Saccostrea echinata]
MSLLGFRAYVITAVEEIPYKSGTAKLIRVRNPWGDTEWNGAWGDGSEEWGHVTNDVKDQLELLSRDDGEFWMNYNDFRREYCNMIVCNLSPDFDHDGINDRAVMVQRRFNGRLPLIISLLQVYRRHEKLDSIGLYAIGFEIFQLYSKPSGALGKSFFDNNDPLMPENEETYARYRETSGRFFLDPGHYILVPTTQMPKFEREYLMRLFSVCKMECVPIANCLPWTH